MIATLRQYEARNHWKWMIGSLAMIWALWLLAFRIYPTVDPIAGAGIVAVTGVLLGVGRQGIDVLVLRLFIASMAMLAATPLHCAGVADCIQGYQIGLVMFGIFGTLLFGVVAVPTSMLWNWGIGGLAPELAWRRLRTVRPWQWAVLAIVVTLGGVAFYLSLGIPAY